MLANFIQVIANVRLPEAERRWQSWLQDRGLKKSDFQEGDVIEELGRGADNKTYVFFYVHRSALERLLPDEYGHKIIKLPPQTE